jgi:hypothetical protein
MRILVKANIPAEAGNRAIKDGSLPQILEAFLAKTRPEAAYFGIESGKRTMFVVLDLPSPADVPPFFEPLFMGFDAQIDLQPIMTLDDLRKGLSSL